MFDHVQWPSVILTPADPVGKNITNNTDTLKTIKKTVKEIVDNGNVHGTEIVIFGIAEKMKTQYWRQKKCGTHYQSIKKTLCWWKSVISW